MRQLNGAPLSSAFVAHFHAIDALEANDVDIEEIVLDLFGEVPARKNSCSRARPRGPFPDVLHLRVLGRIAEIATERRTEVTVVASRIGVDVVAPAIKHAPVRVCEAVGNVTIEFAAARLETKEHNNGIAD